MTADFAQKYETASEDVLAELKKTMESIDPASLERLVDEILKADQVFFVGVGRVMLALQCICKRFAHLGIRAHCVGEINEPAIKKDDLLIVGSGSGGSLFSLGIARKARASVDCTIVHIVRIPVRTKNYLEDEIDSCQPMTSLFEQSVLLLGDVLAKMIIEQKHLDMRSLWQYHANLE